MTSLSNTGKTILYITIMSLLIVFSVELGLRAFFAMKVGPRLLYYGTESHRNWVEASKEKGKKTWEDKNYKNRTVEIHRNTDSGYSKFYPNEKKLEQDFRTGETFEVNINNAGFRGPDFEKVKITDIRILTLGASSTFGFYNKDNETYPYFLQKELNNRCPQLTWEVINFGIPHMTSDNITTLFVNEGIPLQPDFVTFYSGNNDSLIKSTAETLPILSQIWLKLTERLLIFKYLEYAIERFFTSAFEYDEGYASIRSEFFLKNLNILHENAKKNNIQLIVGTQQKRAKTTSGWLPDESQVRELLAGVTYQEEIKKVRQKQEQGQIMSRSEVSLLFHDKLMRDLRDWTNRNEVTLVDMIDVLNEYRHYLLTWVHLHPAANQMIANAWADAIIDQACP